MSGRVKIFGGVFLWVVMAALGFAAKTSLVTRFDTRLDERLVGLRTPALTLLAKIATFAAEAAVGVAVALVVPAVLWFARRRLDALLAGCLMVGAIGTAYLAKATIAEHRPPHRLWVIPPDNPMSFPSGHATIATGIALLLILLVRGSLRPLASVAGICFAGIVASARLYLGVHYLADVAGGFLAAAGAALLVSGVLDVPAIRRRLEDVGTPATGRHHARRFGRDPVKEDH